LHGDTAPTPVDSNQDTVAVKATQSPALTLAKSSPTSTYAAVGDAISYSYELTNSGNVTPSGPFSVTDDHVSSVDCGSHSSLAPGASITCTGSYLVTQSDLDAGA